MYIFYEENYNGLIMNKLQKLKLIRDICEEHNITGYEIGKNTKISSFAAHKILMGDTKNPNESTIDIILEFLENAITGTNLKEDKNAKNIESKSIEDIIAEKVALILQPQLSKLENIEKALSQIILDNDDNEEVLNKKQDSKS